MNAKEGKKRGSALHTGSGAQGKRDMEKISTWTTFETYVSKHDVDLGHKTSTPVVLSLREVVCNY